MSACKYGLPVLEKKIVEVDSTPDFSKYKPIVILKREELAKLLMLLEAMKEPWIAMKFNDTIFVMWREIFFLYMVCEFKEVPRVEQQEVHGS